VNGLSGAERRAAGRELVRGVERAEAVVLFVFFVGADAMSPL
jgi:hypothetical protein